MGLGRVGAAAQAFTAPGEAKQTQETVGGTPVSKEVGKVSQDGALTHT